MAICRRCKAETRRVRTTYHEDTRTGKVVAERDECPSCAPGSFDPRWCYEKPVIAPEAYPEQFKKKYLPDETLSTGTLINPFQYTGREFDAETGHYFYRTRYFDQNNGRFVTEDPIRLVGGFNFYAYVLNNPQNLRDPWGLAGCVYEIHCVHPPEERYRIEHAHDYLFSPDSPTPDTGPTEPTTPPRLPACQCTDAARYARHAQIREEIQDPQQWIALKKAILISGGIEGAKHLGP
jgi:RHS repeat-associated protein